MIATVAAGVAHDKVGNPNEASTSTDNTVDYDVTGPTVTISRALGQQNPTSASPINFTVVFSEPVTDFSPDDVVLSGAAGATAASVTTAGDDGKTYNVSVTGMSHAGPVTVSVPAGAAHDASGQSQRRLDRRRQHGGLFS